MRDPDNGDFAAFAATRGTSLLRFAYLTCGEEQDAEDLLQTALERAYRNWHRIQLVDNPEPYVRRIIVNTFINRARRRSLLRIIPMHAAPEVPIQDGDVTLRHALMDPLRALPPRQRAVIVLRYWEDLSETQIAEVLGCSTGTVKSQASKAIAKLRSSIGDTSSLDGVMKNVRV